MNLGSDVVWDRFRAESLDVNSDETFALIQDIAAAYEYFRSLSAPQVTLQRKFSRVIARVLAVAASHRKRELLEEAWILSTVLGTPNIETGMNYDRVLQEAARTANSENARTAIRNTRRDLLMEICRRSSTRTDPAYRLMTLGTESSEANLVAADLVEHALRQELNSPSKAYALHTQAILNGLEKSDNVADLVDAIENYYASVRNSDDWYSHSEAWRAACRALGAISPEDGRRAMSDWVAKRKKVGLNWNTHFQGECASRSMPIEMLQSLLTARLQLEVVCR